MTKKKPLHCCIENQSEPKKTLTGSFSVINSCAQIPVCATVTLANRPLCSQSMLGSEMKDRGIKSALFSSRPQKGTGDLSILTAGFMRRRCLCVSGKYDQAQANTGTHSTRRFAQVEQQKDRIELKCCRYMELNLLSLKKLI